MDGFPLTLLFPRLSRPSSRVRRMLQVPQPSLDPLQELHIPAQEIWGPVRSRHQEGEARKAMECGDEENFKKEQQKGRKEVGKDK